MNEYTSGFAIADQLEDTLLGYVMANRQLNEQARQFNRAQDLRDRTFAEDTRRFNLDRKDITDARRADKLVAEQILSRNKQKELREKFDKNRREYIENMKNVNLGSGGLFNADYYRSLMAPTRDQFYGEQFDRLTPNRPEITPLQLPQTDMLPSLGLNQILSPQQSTRSLLNMLMLQGGQ
tara:strand:- start:199 stop:738 length:540 start_codon:yes stop_codon:yes gene_type:complete